MKDCNINAQPNYLVIGAVDGLVSQVLLALHVARHPRHCSVLCKRDGGLLHFWPYVSSRIESAFDGTDDDRLVSQINQLSQRHAGVLAIPADCEGAELMHRLRPRLTLACVPFPDMDMLTRFNDKWSFYRFCKEADLPAPDSVLLDSKHALGFDQLAGQLGTPLVIKPLREQGSVGFRVIASKAQWEREVLADEGYRYAPLIAQRHIAGTDIGINLLAVHGEVRALAMQVRDFPQTAGARIRFFHDGQLEILVRHLCRTSRYHGVMNIDARIEHGSHKIFLLESNPRFWQSLGASTWCGLNFVDQCCDPPPRLEDDSRLRSGQADTFHHPLFRPALLGQALLSGLRHRRHMARLMLMDVDLFRRGMKERLRDKPAVHAILRQGQRGMLFTMRMLHRI